MSETMDKLAGTLGELMKKAKEVGGQAMNAVDKNGTVRGVYAKGTERTKAYARIARLTLALNGENEELKKIYTEIGRLYFEQQQGSAGGFFAPLFAQAGETTENIRSIETEIEALKEKIAEESGERDIEVEIGAFDDIVSADEKAAKGEE